MIKKRFISMLVLLAAVVSGAWAQTETLLITINSTSSFTSGSRTFNNIATVTFSSGVDCDDDEDGWYNTGYSNIILSVTPAAGYTITKVKFYCNRGSAFDETSPFEATLYANEMYVNGSSCGDAGVNKIEVYGYAAPATVAVTGVTLSQAEAAMTVGGETLTLTPTVAPSNATNKTVTWTTSNASVATVANGVVTAVAPGTATITATATNGTAATNDDKTATCTVTVTVPVSGVTLSQTEAALNISETLTLTPTVLPAEATNKTVTWTTSNASVATVANGVVTAVAPGTATITATATNGTADTSDDKTATCEVTVSPAGYSVSLKSGTEDATSWQGKAGTDDYQELPLTGLEAGTAVTVKYSGTKKVKSVKAKKKQ